MAVVTSNVRVAVSGALSVAATTATAPTSPTSTLTGFTDLGGISADGVTETRGRTTENITLWQNAALARTVTTEANCSLGLTLVETKIAVVELFYGGTVTTATGYGSIPIDPASTGGRKSFVLDVVDGTELIRCYIPEGEITEVEDQTMASAEAIGYGITIACYYNSTLGGSMKKFYSAFGT